MPTSTTLPSQTSPLLCNDEDILVRAGGDFAVLVPSWQIQAAGTDGVFAPASPWTMTSASADFAAYGVAPNQVVWLTAPKAFYPGGGQLLAIDSVATGQVVLRRPYKDLHVGQPPAPIAGLTGVTFSVMTLDPQIDNASFDIKRRFSVDETIVGRSSSWVFDLRDLRMATVLSVLLDRYTQEQRTATGDFPLKVGRIRQQLDDVLARVQVRWGPRGASAEPSSLTSCKISR